MSETNVENSASGIEAKITGIFDKPKQKHHHPELSQRFGLLIASSRSTKY